MTNIVYNRKIKMAKFKLKVIHSNSKILLTMITTFIGEIIDNYDVIWENNSQRDAILEIIDEFLEDLKDNGKLEQWDVICDKRNNNRFTADSGTVLLDITYRQKNCYNITKLLYAVKR